MAQETPTMTNDSGRPMKWYAIHTHSGFEMKARDALRETAKQYDMTDSLGDIIVPMENVVEVRRGERAQRAKKLLPGYILAEMAFDERMWHVVANTPRVIGFVGGGTNPAPVPAHEVDRLRGQMEQGMKAPKPAMTFSVGDQVKVIDGPFKNFAGSVEEVNADKAKVRVLVSIFGRATPVELDFTQVEPVST
jgi:transcriptional antiterminator NusG